MRLKVNNVEEKKEVIQLFLNMGYTYNGKSNFEDAFAFHLLEHMCMGRSSEANNMTAWMTDNNHNVVEFNEGIPVGFFSYLNKGEV